LVFWVNHRLVSGPAAIPTGPLLGLAIANSVMSPVGVIRPIRPGFSISVNHRLPSRPAAIRLGLLFGVRPAVN
jgi:hypothetical protein